ncbi:AIPR family protein [Actinoplanes sp. CA-051413]|uniref:AIPR family protein n=1 Tax=Actinoplanes sp. CA-051413 TaxID=3239899 RepID=UPI003D95BD6E
MKALQQLPRGQLLYATSQVRQRTQITEDLMSSSPSMVALRARADLMAYGEDKALMLFALELNFSIGDIDSVAAVALTDHSNDKKCDLVYVDRDAGILVFAQGYVAQNDQKSEAPAGKASDLNTAATWLLTGALDTLPEALKSAALEVRDALLSDKINEVHVWYCHNLPESQNVAGELAQVQQTTVSLLRTHYPKTSVNVSVLEIGTATLDEMYRRTQAPIIVAEELEIQVPGGFEVTGDSWRAYCTSVPGEWLRELWIKHKADLMSPNVREYLGVVRSDRNINNGIKTTAKELPGRFWIYNNGLTILVNNYEVGANSAQPGATLRLTGVGIINGAQTTGSIGTLSEADASGLKDMQVMVRFVSCSDRDVLAEIVRYNNSQNKVEATDFRSKDAVQDRLRHEFSTVPDADYRGGRRGGIRDAIERSKFLLADQTVAQSLAAFQGKPNLAYNETRRIWENDGVYASVFTDHTTARQIVLTYSLQKAVEEVKRELSQLPEDGRTASQQKHLGFLRRRGSITLLVAAVAESLESVTGHVIPDRRSLEFKDNCSPAEGVERWRPLVQALLPFVNQLTSAADNDLKNNERVRDALEKFQSMVEATVESNDKIYTQFKQHLKL